MMSLLNVLLHFSINKLTHGVRQITEHKAESSWAIYFEWLTRPSMPSSSLANLFMANINNANFLPDYSGAETIRLCN